MNHCRLISKISWQQRAGIGTLGFFGLFLTLVAMVPKPAEAVDCSLINVICWITYGVSNIVYAVVWLLGLLFTKLTNLLISIIAPYSDFVTSPTVQVGWVIVRDLSNMFFILVLLAIAFGTIFKSEKYNYKTLLPRLLAMAVFINFSRTITGLVIDFAQVIMLTFVNAFQAAAGGNIATSLGVANLLSISAEADAVGMMDVLISLLFAALMLFIMVAVVGVLLATLVTRIIALWVLTILSPGAFFLSTFPAGKQHYDEWWTKLICWAFSGPVIAFFLWLALATMVESGDRVAAVGKNKAMQSSIKNAPTGVVSAQFEELNMTRFVIGIALLYAGLIISQKFCGVGAAFVANTAKSYGTKAVMGVGKWAGKKALLAPVKPLSMLEDKTRIGERILSRTPILGRMKFAQRGAEALQSRRKSLYEEQQKHSKEMAPDTLANLVSKKPVGIMSLKGSSERAAILKQALSTPAVLKNMKPEAQREAFAEYEKIATRSGNPTMLQDLKDLEKKNPLLIGDPSEKDSAGKPTARATRSQEAMKKVSAASALEMDEDTLKAAAPYLNESTKKHVAERGTQKQAAALAEAENKPSLISGANERKAKLKSMQDEEAKRSGLPAPLAASNVVSNFSTEEQAKSYSAMTDEQRQSAIKTLQVGSLTADQLTAEGGKFAAELAQDPTKRKEISDNPDLASSFAKGLQTFLASAKGAALPPARKQEMAVAATMSGAPVSKVFAPGTGTDLDAAMKGPDASGILKNIKAADFSSTPALQSSIVNNIDVNATLPNLLTGSTEQKGLALAIARHMSDAGKDIPATIEAMIRRARL